MQSQIGSTSSIDSYFQVWRSSSGIATECLFPHWLILRTLDSDEAGGARAWNKQYALDNIVSVIEGCQ